MNFTKDQLNNILKKKGYSVDEDHTQNTRKVAKLEYREKASLEGAAQAHESNPSKYVVRVTSVRKRLLDEDNICEKLTVDGLRYAGIIPSDAPDKTHIITTQRKVQKGETEHTLIEIEEIEA